MIYKQVKYIDRIQKKGTKVKRDVGMVNCVPQCVSYLLHGTVIFTYLNSQTDGVTKKFRQPTNQINLPTSRAKSQRATILL